MRKQRIGYVLLLLCVFILAGCQTSKRSTEDPSSLSGGVRKGSFESVSQIPEEDEPVLMEAFGTRMDGGILIGAKGLVAYYDIAKNMLVPLCTRPDCSHAPFSFENPQPDCPAALLFKEGNSFGVYKGKLWYLKQTAPDRSVLCQADVSGENVVECFELPVVEHGLSTHVLWNNHLYMSSSRMLFDDRDVYEGTECCILGIDLETGEEIEIEPVRNYSGTLYRVLGMRKDWLYYYYLPDATNEYPDGKVIRWNCKTREKEEIEFLPGSIRVCEWGGDYLVYSGEQGEKDFYSAVYDLETGENKEIMQSEELVGGYTAFASEIIFYVEGEGVYRCKSDGTEQELLEDVDINLSLTAGWPIFQVNEGYLTYANMNGWFYVTKENFEQGGETIWLTDWEVPELVLPPVSEE